MLDRLANSGAYVVITTTSRRVLERAKSLGTLVELALEGGETKTRREPHNLYKPTPINSHRPPGPAPEREKGAHTPTRTPQGPPHGAACGGQARRGDTPARRTCPGQRRGSTAEGGTPGHAGRRLRAPPTRRPPPAGGSQPGTPPAPRRMRRPARRRARAPRAPAPSVPNGAPGEGRPPSPQPPIRGSGGRGDGLSRWGADWRRNAVRLPHP
jgi:hypothetical protein